MPKMTKLQKKQQKLKRDYLRAFNKLSMYNQEPIRPLDRPWQRDIDRLNKRYKTVKKYTDYYYQLNEQIEEFNATYHQNIPTFTAHQRITSATYETLKKYGRQAKRKMRSFENRIQNEADMIERNIKGMLNVAYDYTQPTHYTSAGEKTTHQEIVSAQTSKFVNFYNEVVPDSGIERYIALSNIRSKWDTFTQAFDKFIYDSDTEKVQEAWATIVYILTGDGLRASDIDSVPVDDMVYE